MDECDLDTSSKKNETEMILIVYIDLNQKYVKLEHGRFAHAESDQKGDFCRDRN